MKCRTPMTESIQLPDCTSIKISMIALFLECAHGQIRIIHHALTLRKTTVSSNGRSISFVIPHDSTSHGQYYAKKYWHDSREHSVAGIMKATTTCSLRLDNVKSSWTRGAIAYSLQSTVQASINPRCPCGYESLKLALIALSLQR
jgi:hypothetical protein